MERTTGSQRLTLNLFRIMTGFLFWQHGAQKFMGWLGGVGQDGGTADLVSWMGLAGILEFFGGALIILGWFTRPVALILAGEMAVAYFWVHHPRGFWPILNGGEKAAFFCFAYLFMAARGGGRFSIDGWRGRK
jgi:putative oxidoreductase